MSDLSAFLAERGCTLNSLLVLRDGAPLAETYWAPYGADTLQHTYSVTKSVISALVGIAIADGSIGGVDQPLVELLPGEVRRSGEAQLAAVTVQHALTMTCGLQWGETRARYARRSNPVQQMQQTRDWVRYIVTRRIVSPPGSRFEYSSGASHLLAAVLENATGMSVAAYAERRLFEPLGISDYAWTTDPRGTHTGGWGLYLRPRDMASLGTLYLNGGRWNGRAIVPEDWVQESTREHVQARPAYGLRGRVRSLARRLPRRPRRDVVGYGYHWWLPDFGGYAALGAGGQSVYVLPDDRVVVAITAGLTRERTALRHELMTRLVLPELRSPGPPRLERGDAPTRSPPLRRPPAADVVSGRTYTFKRNASGFSSIALDFPREGDAELTVSLDARVHALRVGLDEEFRHNPIDAQSSLALRGRWAAEREFRLEWCWMGSGERLEISLRFAGDRLSFESRGAIDGHRYRIVGRSSRWE